ncbi:MAG: hypothetical protein ACOY46_09755 [Bacillota bacterium]
MADNKKQETLTASGYEYDKDLVKVPIKVSPALQAIIANQLDLIELIEKGGPKDPVFIAQHRAELAQVEEEIAGSFSKYLKKKEAEKSKRAVKKEAPVDIPEWSPENPGSSGTKGRKGTGRDDWYPPGADMEEQLDRMADRLSPGLPSSKYEKRTRTVEQAADVDVKRVAVGASIKALSGFLGRELTEEEIAAIEKQVESYL